MLLRPCLLEPGPVSCSRVQAFWVTDRAGVHGVDLPAFSVPDQRVEVAPDAVAGGFHESHGGVGGDGGIKMAFTAVLSGCPARSGWPGVGGCPPPMPFWAITSKGKGRVAEGQFPAFTVALGEGWVHSEYKD